MKGNMVANINKEGKVIFRIVRPTPLAKRRYLEIAKEVFFDLDFECINQNVDKFSKATRFYIFEEKNKYLSFLFLTPVSINSIILGGIGGVATKKDYRGKGYATRLLEKVIHDTKGVYPALMLWTRIPDFFFKVGFEDVSLYFEKDPKGSMPMMYFYNSKSEVFSNFSAMIPRSYF
jgi:N-acetylglutamate synthase-like GNAT family acetyltransferase